MIRPAACIVVKGQKRPDLDQRWVTAGTLADYLAIEVTTVSRWARNGELPLAGMRRHGRVWRFQPAACCRAGAALLGRPLVAADAEARRVIPFRRPG